MVLLFLLSGCATLLYTLRCNPRKAMRHGKGGVCECLAMPWSVGGVKGQISLISYCARINPFLPLTFAIFI